MENTKRRGVVPAIIGGVTIGVALLMTLVTIIYYGSMSIDYYLNDYPTMFMNWMLDLGALTLFFIGALVFAVKGKGRVLLGIAGIIVACDEMIMPIINSAMYGYGYDVENFLELFISTTFLMAVFIAIFSFVKAKGVVVPIFAYILIGLDIIHRIYITIDELDIIDIYWYSDEVFAFFLIDYISWVLIPVGLIIAVPAILHIRKQTVAPAPQFDPVYNAVPPVQQPIQPPVQPPMPDFMNDDMFEMNVGTVCTFLETYGYEIRCGNYEMSVSKAATDDGQQSVDRFIAKSDGIYNFVEVIMGGYDLRKRLDCPDFCVSCIIVLAKFVMECVKSGDATDTPEFRDVLSILKTYENGVIYHFSRSVENYRNQYLLEDYFDLISVYEKLN